GSSGDSGFHRESDQEDAKIKDEPGIGVSTEDESPSSHLKSEGYIERQSAGRNSGKEQEAGSAMDHEEKPHPPPLGPSGPLADRDVNRDPPDEAPPVKTEGSSSTTTPPIPRFSAKKKSPSKLGKPKMRAPDAEESGDVRTWTPDQLQKIFYRKQLNEFLLEDPVMIVMKPRLIGELQGPVKPLPQASDFMAAITSLMNMLEDAGIVAGAFDADTVFELSLTTVEESSKRLFKLLKLLVGATASLSSLGPMEEYPTSASSHSGFASAKASVFSDIGSDSSTKPVRMTLGPSGAAMLEARKIKEEKSQVETAVVPKAAPNPNSPGRMQSFFNTAMDRFLKEQSEEKRREQPKVREASDVDMESMRSFHPSPDEYDPDDLSIDVPRRVAVASAEAAAPSGGAEGTPRVRMAAISELKEFSGRDTDEDRARSWLGKVKSAFIRDQAPDSEKCIVFGNLLTGPARNWYQQLGRTTRGSWKDLLDGFRVEYCGLGVSLARQYYHAMKRSDESPLEYLHRLTVLGLRAKLAIKTGTAAVLREHVEHFIETLDDRDLADHLTLLRLADGDALADVLRVRQRAKSRQRKSAAGSTKYRQKAPSAPPQASSKPTRAVRAIRMAIDSDGSGSESDSGGSDLDQRRSQVYLAAVADQIHEAGECPMEEFYNLIRQWYDPTRHAGMFPSKAEKMQAKSKVSSPKDPINNTRGIHEKRTLMIASLRKDEYARSDVVMELDLADGKTRGYWKDHAPDTEPGILKAVNSITRTPPEIGWDLRPGESRGYWKYYSPGKWFKQAKITGKINNSKATMLLDSGAEVSIVDTTFARKVGCIIDESQRQECVGIGENVYTTLGRTTIKVTLAGYLVYFFDAWVGALAGQDAILGMDFMVPAGIRLDFADGTMCLADEVRIQLSGRRPPYGRSRHSLLLEANVAIPVGDSVEIPLKPPRALERVELWTVRGEQWVPTVAKGLGRRRHLRITNVGDHELHMPRSTELGMWLAEDLVPRVPGHVSVGSRRNAEWQTLAFEATTEQRYCEEPPPVSSEPLVERPLYDPPTKILRRGEMTPRPTVAAATVRWADPIVTDAKPSEPKVAAVEAITDQGSQVHREGEVHAEPEADLTLDAEATVPTLVEDTPTEETPEELKIEELEEPAEIQEDAEGYYHEGGCLSAEDLEGQMAILPEIVSTTEEVKIEDVQAGDPKWNTPEEINRLRRIIWKRNHLLIGKGNALPPAAVGVVCDIDVGGAAPIAQRVRRVAPQYREKLSDLIKGLLTAKIIVPSTSPWVSCRTR
ncbi:hypothetical protein PHMEG_00026468, partial [Phytophthora megakarya]